ISSPPPSTSLSCLHPVRPPWKGRHRYRASGELPRVQTGASPTSALFPAIPLPTHSRSRRQPPPHPATSSPTSPPSFLLLRCCLKTPWRLLKLCSRSDERCGDELGWEARAPWTIWVRRDHGCSHLAPTTVGAEEAPTPWTSSRDLICFPCNVAYLYSIQAAATALEMQDELLAREPQHATPTHLHGRHPQATKMTTRSPTTAAPTTTSPSPRFALQDGTVVPLIEIGKRLVFLAEWDYPAKPYVFLLCFLYVVHRGLIWYFFPGFLAGSTIFMLWTKHHFHC
ncbi:uncharacterized protein LOC119345443, partial [Triticum dicoccoides]|uniref:uncharacterized protein LOC119345443 n=1 Tax=Triticum dicoccoides TaxID=85692 RepID=UPI00188E7664